MNQNLNQPGKYILIYSFNLRDLYLVLIDLDMIFIELFFYIFLGAFYGTQENFKGLEPMLTWTNCSMTYNLNMFYTKFNKFSY